MGVHDSEKRKTEFVILLIIAFIIFFFCLKYYFKYAT